MNRRSVIAVLGIIAFCIVVIVVAKDRNPQPTTSGEARAVSGSFVSWEPLDDARGYANFTVTNYGSQATVAQCIVEVRSDFGDSGFEIMTGETVAARQTSKLRLPIKVGSGSRLINSGTVKNC